MVKRTTITIFLPLLAVLLAGCAGWPRGTCQPGIKPPLVKAIEAGDRTRVAQLLQDGANPNIGQPPFGPPPLDIAIEKGDPAIISILKTHGAKTRAEFREQYEKQILEDRRKTDALVKAIEASDAARVAQLLQDGAHPNGRPLFAPSRLPLDIAIEKGDPVIISILRAHGAKSTSEFREQEMLKSPNANVVPARRQQP